MLALEPYRKLRVEYEKLRGYYGVRTASSGSPLDISAALAGTAPESGSVPTTPTRPAQLSADSTPPHSKSLELVTEGSDSSLSKSPTAPIAAQANSTSASTPAQCSAPAEITDPLTGGGFIGPDNATGPSTFVQMVKIWSTHFDGQPMDPIIQLAIRKGSSSDTYLNFGDGAATVITATTSAAAATATSPAPPPVLLAAALLEPTQKYDSTESAARRARESGTKPRARSAAELSCRADSSETVISIPQQEQINLLLYIMKGTFGGTFLKITQLREDEDGAKARLILATIYAAAAAVYGTGHVSAQNLGDLSQALQRDLSYGLCKQDVAVLVAAWREDVAARERGEAPTEYTAATEIVFQLLAAGKMAATAFLDSMDYEWVYSGNEWYASLGGAE